MIGYFGMVTGFPLDPMHSVYHGAIKNWFKKLFDKLTPNNEKPLPMPVKIQLDRILDFMKHFTPSEFSSSSLKSLNHQPSWKAAETRHFIMYAAIILFRGIVPQAVYNSLLCLVVGLLFIAGDSPTPVPDEHLRYAQTLFERFLQAVARDHFHGLPPSLHWLLHIVADLQFFGCHLERLGAWPFENSMRFILNSVHSGNRVVEQILNREDEKMEFNLRIDDEGSIMFNDVERFMPENRERDTPYVKTNKRGKRSLIFPKNRGDFVLKATKNNRDCHFIYQFGTDIRYDVVIGKFLDVVESERTGRLVIVGQEYKEKGLIFQHPGDPCDSDRFYGFKFWDLSPITNTEFEVTNVVGKMYAFPDRDLIKADKGNTESQIAEKLKLVKYMATVLPKDAPQAPPPPNFRKLCESHFDAWEGFAVQHTYKTIP
jgi:hypothetical protein